MLNLINANASVIAVTSTATLLTDLMDTAAGADQQFPTGVKGCTLIPENGDIRILGDGNTPSTSKGVLLKRGGVYNIPSDVDLGSIKLVRVGSTDVSVGVIIGAAITGFAPEVGLNTALQAFDATGANQSNVGVVFIKPTDDFEATQELSSSTSPQQVYAGVANKYLEIHSISISTDTAQWVKLQDNAGTPAKITSKKYLPANGTWTKSFTKPKRVALGKDINAVCGGAVGNISVDIEGRIVS